MNIYTESFLLQYFLLSHLGLWILLILQILNNIPPIKMIRSNKFSKDLVIHFKIPYVLEFIKPANLILSHDSSYSLLVYFL